MPQPHIRYQHIFDPSLFCFQIVAKSYFLAVKAVIVNGTSAAVGACILSTQGWKLVKRYVHLVCMDAVINFQKCINKPSGDGVGRFCNVLKIIWFKSALFWKLYGSKVHYFENYMVQKCTILKIIWFKSALFWKFYGSKVHYFCMRRL